MAIEVSAVGWEPSLALDEILTDVIDRQRAGSLVRGATALVTDAAPA